MKIWLSVCLLVFLIGCGTNETPTQTAIPQTAAPTATVSPTLDTSPTALATAEALPNSSLLDIFPLRKGAEWVYREEAYDTVADNIPLATKSRKITATLAVTDTVAETETHDEMYAAQVIHARSIVTTSIDLNQLGADGQHYFSNEDRPEFTWYIFADNKVYEQYSDLDWDSVEQSSLTFQFPLVEGKCWYPDPGTASDCASSDPSAILPGFRRIESLEPQQTPAGNFANCFLVRDVYNPGDEIAYFCNGVGIVGRHFDHAGTPFGSHSTLIQFIPGR